MKRVGNGRILQQRVHAAEYGVELRQHLLHDRYEVFHLSHRTVVDASHDGLSRVDALTHIVGKEQVHLHVAHEVANYFSATAFRYAHVFVDACLNDDILCLAIVVLDVSHHTHLIAVGIDGA